MRGIFTSPRGSVPCSAQMVATKRTSRTSNMSGSERDEPARLLKLVASLPCAGAFGDRRWRDRRRVAIGPPSLLGRPPGAPGDRDGIADHCVRQCDQRSDIVEVHWRNYAIRGQMNNAV